MPSKMDGTDDSPVIAAACSLAMLPIVLWLKEERIE